MPVGPWRRFFFFSGYLPGVARRWLDCGMLELERWGVDKPIPLVIFAHMAATSADALCEGCQRARDGAYAGAKGMADVRTWYKLYRRHRRVMEVASENAFGLEVAGESTGTAVEMAAKIMLLGRIGLAEAGTECAKLGPAEQAEALKEGMGEVGRMYRSHLEEIQVEIREQAGGSRRVESLLEIPEVVFFLRVGLPCWLEYGMPVARLLREARSKPESEAAEKLLRLDKAALEDSRIRGRYCRAAADGRTGVVERLNAALAGGPLRPVSRRKIKVALGSLVWKVFAQLDEKVKGAMDGLGITGWKGIRLTVPEVRSLFDAVARDYRGELRDMDLPESDEALYMAVRREVGFWPNLP